MIGRPFTCGLCGGSFTSTRSEEEGIAEMRATFVEPPPEATAEDRALEQVCDECWKTLQRYAAQHHLLKGNSLMQRIRGALRWPR